MITNFQLKNPQEFDRALLFLSADFFVEYWGEMSGNEFPKAEAALTQESARRCVLDFMSGETLYWDIDFSESRLTDTALQFSKATEKLSVRSQELLALLIKNYCSDELERASASYASGFLHRINTDPVFARGLSLSISQREIVAACVESSHIATSELYELKYAWLNSETEWDTQIRSYTPDIPEYVYLNFSEVIAQGTELPIFARNLASLLDLEARLQFLKILNSEIEKSFPKDSGLMIPQALKLALV